MVLDKLHDNQTEHKEKTGRRRFLKGAGATVGGLTLGSVGASPAAASHQTLTIGEDTTYTELNRSKADEVIQGAIVLDRGASTANRTGKYIRTDARALTGIGTARYWGEVGRRFFAEGDSAQLAEIKVQGHIKGYLRAIANSGAQGILHLKIVDFTEGTTVQDSIFRAGGNNIVDRTIDQNFSGSITTQLQPGHNYTVWVRLTSRIDTLTDDLNVLPRADFFSDSTNRRAVVDEISVRF